MEETTDDEINRLRKFYHERTEEDIKLLKSCLNMMLKVTGENRQNIEKMNKEIEELKRQITEKETNLEMYV